MWLEVTNQSKSLCLVYVFKNELSPWWRQTGDLHSVTTKSLLNVFFFLIKGPPEL